MFEQRQPKYQWGQKVSCTEDLHNDGSYPDLAEDALLAPAGSVGEVVNIGHHAEANIPIYLVEFPPGIVVGCFEEELTAA
jgi:nitrogen fixation protein NifZ